MSNPPNELFDIMIPVYNYAKFLPYTIKSVIHQTYKYFRIVVIDNCSTDDTYKIVKDLMQNEPRLSYIKNSYNVGLVENYNRALELSKSEYVMILGGDDLLSKHFLEEVYKIIKANKNINAVITRVVNIDVNGKPIRSSRFFSPIPQSRFITQEDLYFKGIITTPSSCVFVQPKEKFNPNIKYNFDEEFLLRILKNKGKIYFVNKPLVFFRIHELTQSNLINIKNRFRDEFFVKSKYLAMSKSYNEIMMKTFIRYSRTFYLKSKYDESRKFIFQSIFYTIKAFGQLYFWKILILNIIQMIKLPILKFKRIYDFLIK